MRQAFIGLGSNIEPRENYLTQAILRLKVQDNIDVIERSSIYETDPVDYLDQADFLNMVVKVSTSLDAMALLGVCQQIERELKREKVIDKGPRTIDLDILLYGEDQFDFADLQIPHPRMHTRAFVLVPLSEIAAHEKVVTTNSTVKELYDNLNEADTRGVKKWDEG